MGKPSGALHNFVAQSRCGEVAPVAPGATEYTSNRRALVALFVFGQLDRGTQLDLIENLAEAGIRQLPTPNAD